MTTYTWTDDTMRSGSKCDVDKVADNLMYLKSAADNIDLSSCADTSLSNLNSTGKSVASNLAMPSSSYINLTLGASGSTYTAPADGYLYVSKFATSSNQELLMYTSTYGTTAKAEANQVARLFLPIKGGNTATIYYTLTGSTDAYRFIYAEGSKP